jgi:hypothetical protein
VRAVVEAQPLGVPAGRGERGEHLGVDLRPGGVVRYAQRELAQRATRRRSRGGSTCSSLASARSETSSTPVNPVAARSPTTVATASSSSSSSGGSCAPAPSR